MQTGSQVQRPIATSSRFCRPEGDMRLGSLSGNPVNAGAALLLSVEKADQHILKFRLHAHAFIKQFAHDTGLFCCVIQHPYSL